MLGSKGSAQYDSPSMFDAQFQHFKQLAMQKYKKIIRFNSQKILSIQKFKCNSKECTVEKVENMSYFESSPQQIIWYLYWIEKI